MVKKSHQAAARYAKQSGKGKRKQPRIAYPKGAVSTDAPHKNTIKFSSGQDLQSRPLAKTGIKTSGIKSAYSYVASDLKRTSIIAVAIFIILIALVILLG